MGGGQKSTTATQYQQTPEEKEYNQVQIDLAKQQLALTQEQHGWNSEIFAMTKPLLAKYGLMVEQQFNDYNSPEASDLRKRYASLENAQLDQQIRNMPIQDELMQLQLDEIRRGGRATDEQKRLIGEIADRAIETGDTDISRFLDKGFLQMREELAPARGLRPTDSPILDAGGQVLEEALRQKGQLTSQVRGAQANAELNFPLNASQVYSAQNQFQQNFNANMGQFLAQQRAQGDQNRAALMTQLFTSPMSAGEAGINLINASRPSPVSFPRNSTQTTKTSGGSILGGIGGLLSGIGSIASSGMFSSKKLKEDVKPIEAPPGHMLSPGGLKFDRRAYSSGDASHPRFSGGYDHTQTTRPGAWSIGSNPLPGGMLRNMTSSSLMSDLGGKIAADPGTRDWVGGSTYDSGGTGMPVRPFVSNAGSTIDFDTLTGGGLGGSGSSGGSGGKDYGNDGPQVDPTVWGQGDGPQVQPGQGLGFAAGPPVSDDDALDRIVNLPVSQWRYKPETGLGTEQHVGPMAEDFNTQVMGREPGPTIPIVDNMGALTLAIKALEKRTRKGGIPRNQYQGINQALTRQQIAALMQRRKAA